MTKIILLIILALLTLSGCGKKEPNKTDENAERKYAWVGEDQYIETASVTLNRDGTFFMFFSPISSYIGHGEYTESDGRLVLNTDDGNFTYAFDVTSDGIMFDGGSSSEFTWYSNLSDGDVLLPVIADPVESK